MTRYNSTGRHTPSYYGLYELDASGEILGRPPIDNKVKVVLDQIRARERNIERFARWVNNRQ